MQSCVGSDGKLYESQNCTGGSPFWAFTLPGTLKYFGRHLYIIENDEAYAETIEKVPKFEAAAVPLIIVSLMVEYIILRLKGKRTHALGDGIGSASTGIMKEMCRMLSKGLQHSIYIWVYKNYCIYELPWDSPYTWYFTAIVVDFAYYWGHRAGHELNIFWAHHQAHHNSDYLNFFISLRQGPLQVYFLWCFMLPFALFIPPTQYLLHIQFNLLVQFWLHTEAIDTVGPLEYILNTPSHHRVHHGSNPYCIDKNYGGALIIWDKMFGTFAAERKDEKLVYGLVHQLNTANPIKLVGNHFPVMWNNFWAMEGFGNKMRVLFYGPAWVPGDPRMGDYSKIPPADQNRVPFTPHTSKPRFAYILVHFVLLLLGHQCVAKQETYLSDYDAWSYALFIVLTLYCFGDLFENTRTGPYLEFLRCALFLASTTTKISLLTSMGESLLTRETMYCLLRAIFTVSAAIWGSVSLYQLSGQGKQVKEKSN